MLKKEHIHIHPLKNVYGEAGCDGGEGAGNPGVKISGDLQGFLRWV